MCQKSWFSGSRLSFEKVLALTYCWAQTFTTGQVMHETSLDDKITLTETVIDWYYYCHEVRAHGIMNHHESCRVNMTVLLSFEEKTEDTCTCA